jgi:hypothetical protein
MKKMIESVVKYILFVSGGIIVGVVLYFLIIK